MAKKSAKKKIAKRSSPGKNFWLMKSEPDCFSIHDLANSPNQTTHWDGVRNYQARNFMRDDMKIGDEVLYYHSNAKPPCVVGTATIVKESYPDFTSWDKNDKHYDAKSTPEEPRWFMVDIKLKDIFAEPLTRDDVASLKECDDMELLRRGSRLSVQPVSKKEYDSIVKLAKKKMG